MPSSSGIIVGVLVSLLVGFGFWLQSRGRSKAKLDIEASRKRLEDKLNRLKSEQFIVTAEEERAIRTAEKMAGEADLTAGKIETIDKVLDGIFSRYPPPGVR